MLGLARILAALPKAGHVAGGWMLLILAFVIGYDVVGRKFFNTGSVTLQDLEWHLHGAAMLLGFGAAYLKDAHVRVDLVRDGFSDRAKLILESAGIVLFLVPYTAILAWFSVDYVHRAYLTNEGSVAGGGLDHRWVIKSFLIVGLVLTVLAAVAVLLRCLSALRRGEPMREAFETFD